MKRAIVLTLAILLLIGVGYWVFIYVDSNSDTPTNPPTKEELERMREIEESSAQIAPNAVPGAGVRPVGSLPPKNVETEMVSTTTEDATTTEPADLP